MKSAIAFLLAVFGFTCFCCAQVVINEFSASNLHFFQDGYGDYSDYIELYNNSAAPVDISGFHLSDNLNDPMKWEIPAGTIIPAFGFELYFPSAKLTTQFDGQHYHLPFQLTQSSQEDVVFADPLGTVLDSVLMEYPTQMNHSRGRTTDGGPDWGVMTTPTPGSSNVNVYDDYTERPVFNLEAGFYNGTQTVSISITNPDHIIRYTTNGTKPNWNSTEYTGPITVNNTMTIRARSFPPGDGGGGGSSDGYCDVAQGSAGFPSDPTCQNAICSADPFCCNNQWDGICADAAEEEPLCGGCLSPENAMYCDEVQGFAGFPLFPTCENAVCSQDAFCCNNTWDGICVGIAQSEPACEECSSTYIPPPPDDPDGNYFPGFTETNTYFIDETFTFRTVALSGQLGQWGAGGGGGWMNVNGVWHNHYEVCLEYFDEDGIFQTELEGTARRHGNDSWAFNQRGIRFHSRDQQGFDNNIDYPLFPQKDRNKYDVIIMKAGGSDNYHQTTGLHRAHLRDGFAQTASQRAGLELDERTYAHQITFLNGLYWGVYEMRERVDKDFTERYYDQPEEYVDLMKYWGGLEEEYGSIADWNTLHNFITTNDMAVQLNYDYAVTQLNPESFIDNFVINTYFVNTDWLNWNTMWWRGNHTLGSAQRWRYALWDLDNTFNLGQNYTGWPGGTGPYVNTVCEAQNMFQNWSAANGHTAIYSALLENEGFFTQYLNRYADLLNTGLHCDTLVALLDEFEANMLPEMPRQVNRWGGTVNNWQDRVDEIRDFICLRWSIVMDQIVDCFEDDYDISGPYEVTVVIIGPGNVQFNTVNIQTGPWTASYFGGLDIGLIAIPLPNGEFIEWEINNNFVGQDLLSENLLLTLNENDTIFAYFDFIDPLPVEWLSFNGELNDLWGELDWATASEINSSHFEVLRSADGQNFEKIGEVASSGNSNTPRNYQFTDKSLPEGIQYYRLKQVDFDGANDYSNTIAIDYGLAEKAILIAPNPNNGEFLVHNHSAKDIRAELLTPLSQHLRFLTISAGRSTNINLEAPSAGIYLLRYKRGDQFHYHKIAVH